MALSRRRFLGVAAGAAAAAGGVQVLRTTVFDDDVVSAAPDKQRFLDAVGTNFDFRVDAVSSVQMRLAKVSDGPADPRAGQLIGESFELAFDAPRSASFGQGTYLVNHKKLGRFALFVAPTRRNEGYTAVINRRLPKA
jgi:hypothetical protein